MEIIDSARYLLYNAVMGAGMGYMAKSLGYDFSAVEGIKQATLASLPFLILSNLVKPTHPSGDFENYLGNLSLTTGVSFFSAFLSTAYMLGGETIELLSGIDLTPPFTLAVGGLEGLLAGIANNSKNDLERKFPSNKYKQLDL